MAVIGPIGSEGGKAGWLRITDVVVPGGVASNKIFQDTNNTVLQSCNISELAIEIEVSSSFPIAVEGANQTELTPSADGGHYEGTVSVTVVGSIGLTIGSLDPENQPGAQDTVVLTYDAPPQILTAVFTGGYPGAQTELKAGDTFQITGTTDINADAIDIQDLDACDASLEVIAVGTAFTITGTIADRGTVTQHLAARVRARHPTSGAFGATFDTDATGVVDGVNRVFLNNTFPSVAYDSIVYPVTQSALKASEQATVNVTVLNTNSLIYDSPNSELSIASPTVDSPAKVVTRIAGTYNVSTNNLRVVATRSANAAQATFQTVVSIANVAPTIDITLPAARLRSGGNHGTVAQDHEVTITANQLLGSAPSLAADGGGNRGTFQGGGFTGAGSVWTRDLRVDETVPDEKGTFTFGSLAATGLSGLVQNTINSGASYTLGGFVARTLNYPAFTANSTEAVVVADQTKLASGLFSNGNQGVPQVFGTADTSDVGKEGWFAPTAASGSVNIRMLHTLMVAANTTGITLASLEETV